MPASNYINFTKREIERLPLPAPGSQQVRYFDELVRGLYILVSPGGTKTFYCRRKLQGKSERLCIGRFPDLSIEQARTKAQEFQSQLSVGQNFAEVRRQSHKEMTLEELFEHYVEKHLSKKGRRVAEITASFDKAFSHWKTRRLSVIDPTEVMELHQKIADTRGPLAANRAIEILRAMFNKAIKWRFFEGRNPATIVTMFPENARSRVLDEGEYERLQAALDREANPVMRDFFMLALLTGARKSNLLAMRWKDINFTTGTWTIPGEVTKTGDQYIVALTDIDLAILKKRMVSAPGEYVFPGDKNHGHLADPKRAWARVLKRAKITDLRLHDLRRSMASWMANSGANASVIQGALNHKDIKTTMLVYAHTAKNAERDAKAKAQQSLLKGSKRRLNVISFPKQ
jgi:integrase